MGLWLWLLWERKKTAQEKPDAVKPEHPVPDAEKLKQPRN